MRNNVEKKRLEPEFWVLIGLAAVNLVGIFLLLCLPDWGCSSIPIAWIITWGFILLGYVAFLAWRVYLDYLKFRIKKEQEYRNEQDKLAHEERKAARVNSRIPDFTDPNIILRLAEIFKRKAEKQYQDDKLQKEVIEELPDSYQELLNELLRKQNGI